MSEKFKINRVLVECKQLPSAFGFYPKGTKVWFYPMTTKEVEVLNESDITSLNLFKNSLENIKTEKIRPEDLTFSDFIFVSLQRRLYSQTEIRCTLKSSCPSCGTVIVDEFDFNDIEFEEPKDNRFQCTEIGGYKVEVGPITIGSMIEILGSEEGVNTVNTLAAQIRKIYVPGSEVATVPIEDTKELAKEIIANSWGEERECLSYIDDLQTHSMKHRKLSCKNKACATTWEEDLGNPETLIFPSDRPRQSIASKVHPC